MAPAINPKAIAEPNQINAGTKRRMDATNSITPTAMRPHGSMPTVEKIKTDSSEPVNLKYKVCSIINAATMRAIQNKATGIFMG